VAGILWLVGVAQKPFRPGSESALITRVLKHARTMARNQVIESHLLASVFNKAFQRDSASSCRGILCHFSDVPTSPPLNTDFVNVFGK